MADPALARRAWAALDPGWQAACARAAPRLLELLDRKRLLDPVKLGALLPRTGVEPARVVPYLLQVGIAERDEDLEQMAHDFCDHCAAAQAPQRGFAERVGAVEPVDVPPALAISKERGRDADQERRLMVADALEIALAPKS